MLEKIFKYILIGVAIFMFIFITISVIIPVQNDNITYFMCCDNLICSDTYYSAKDNLCHLVLGGNSYKPTNTTELIWG